MPTVMMIGMIQIGMGKNITSPWPLAGLTTLAGHGNQDLALVIRPDRDFWRYLIRHHRCTVHKGSRVFEKMAQIKYDIAADSDEEARLQHALDILAQMDATA